MSGRRPLKFHLKIYFGPEFSISVLNFLFRSRIFYLGPEKIKQKICLKILNRKKKEKKSKIFFPNFFLWLFGAFWALSLRLIFKIFKIYHPNKVGQNYNFIDFFWVERPSFISYIISCQKISFPKFQPHISIRTLYRSILRSGPFLKKN